MDAGRIKDYLGMMGCRKIAVRGSQVYSTCPNEINHSKGRDTRPSFSVKAVEGGKSPTYCFACCSHDSFEWMVYERLGDRGPLSGTDGDNRRVFSNVHLWGTPLKEIEEAVIFPERLLAIFSGKVPKYAIRRGLTIETCKAWGLGYDMDNERLIFTIRNDRRELVGVSGRAVSAKGEFCKYANYSLDKTIDRLVPFVDHEREDDFVHFKKSLALYGEHMLTYDDPRVVVVEGQMDAIMVWQHGYNVVATMGASVSDGQYGRLLKIGRAGKDLIILFDGDKAGQEGAEKAIKMLGDRIRVFRAVCPEGKDPGGMTKEEIDTVINKTKLS